MDLLCCQFLTNLIHSYKHFRLSWFQFWLNPVHITHLCLTVDQLAGSAFTCVPNQMTTVNNQQQECQKKKTSQAGGSAFNSCLTGNYSRWGGSQRMPFITSNQQSQSTKGTEMVNYILNNNYYFWLLFKWSIFQVRLGPPPPTEGRNCRAPWKNRTSQYISFFPPIIQWCSISDVLFTGGKAVSDFSVLKYY